MEAIRKNMVALIRDTSDAVRIADYLVSVRVFSIYTIENIEAARTNSEKNRIVYNEITRRGPNAFGHLLNALDATGNGHLADALRCVSGYSKYSVNISGATGCVQIGDNNCMTIGGASHKRDDIPPTRIEKGIFGDVTLAIASLRPAKTTSVRSNNPVFKVAVNMFTDATPKSNVGISDLPYVMALYKGTPKDSVTRWPGCPTSLALDVAYRVYEAEVSSAMHILNSLGDGAIDVSSTPTEDMTKAMKVLMRQPSLLLHQFNPSSVSEDEKKTMAMTLHLITFGQNMRMVVRKDFAPKPSAYTCYNASSFSPIIKDKDRGIVLEIIGEDESNFEGTESTMVSCPF